MQTKSFLQQICTDSWTRASGIRQTLKTGLSHLPTTGLWRGQATLGHFHFLLCDMLTWHRVGTCKLVPAKALNPQCLFLGSPLPSSLPEETTEGSQGWGSAWPSVPTWLLPRAPSSRGKAEPVSHPREGSSSPEGLAWASHAPAVSALSHVLSLYSMCVSPTRLQDPSTSLPTVTALLPLLPPLLRLLRTTVMTTASTASGGFTHHPSHFSQQRHEVGTTSPQITDGRQPLRGSRTKPHSDTCSARFHSPGFPTPATCSEVCGQSAPHREKCKVSRDEGWAGLDRGTQVGIRAGAGGRTGRSFQMEETREPSAEVGRWYELAGPRSRTETGT